MFAGCGSEKSDDSTQQIIGQWRLIDDENNEEIRRINDGFPVDNFYVYEDGQMTMNGENATYAFQGDEFSICSFWRGTDYYEYYINGDRLALTKKYGTYEGYTAYYERIK